jgi:tetratricopeptide (TPR) repeat protein
MKRKRMARFFRVALLGLPLVACQAPEPAPVGAGTPASRDQTWKICQDASRGMAAVDACTSLIQSGQETDRTLTYLHYNRGMALARRGRTQMAIEDFDAALKQDPQFAVALYQRGLAYQTLGQTIRAEEDLRRARQLNPRLP